jgi:hypothetical protein
MLTDIKYHACSARGGTYVHNNNLESDPESSSPKSQNEVFKFLEGARRARALILKLCLSMEFGLTSAPWYACRAPDNRLCSLREK